MDTLEPILHTQVRQLEMKLLAYHAWALMDVLAQRCMDIIIIHGKFLAYTRLILIQIEAVMSNIGGVFRMDAIITVLMARKKTRFYWRISMNFVSAKRPF